MAMPWSPTGGCIVSGQPWLGCDLGNVPEVRDLDCVLCSEDSQSVFIRWSRDLRDVMIMSVTIQGPVSAGSTFAFHWRATLGFCAIRCDMAPLSCAKRGGPARGVSPSGAIMLATSMNWNAFCPSAQTLMWLRDGH